MHYWESIADQLKDVGYSLGWVKAVEAGNSLWTVDAKKDGKTFISKADSLTTAFLELRAMAGLVDVSVAIMAKSDRVS